MAQNGTWEHKVSLGRDSLDTFNIGYSLGLGCIILMSVCFPADTMALEH